LPKIQVDNRRSRRYTFSSGRYRRPGNGRVFVMERVRIHVSYFTLVRLYYTSIDSIVLYDSFQQMSRLDIPSYSYGNRFKCVRSPILTESIAKKDVFAIFYSLPTRLIPRLRMTLNNVYRTAPAIPTPAIRVPQSGQHPSGWMWFSKIL